MKKILVVALSVALLLSTTACGTNSELEALKQENEQLKSQLSDTEEKPTDSTYELTAGNYEVPADIPAGKYDIVAVSGHGVFTINNTDGYADLSEFLGVDNDEYAIKEYKNAKILEGNTIEISSTLKAKLVPNVTYLSFKFNLNGDVCIWKK